MKHYIFLIILFLLISCKDQKKEIENPVQVVSKVVTEKTYPEGISKIFDAHGGLDNWNSSQALSFTMDKTAGQEVTLTDLKNRKSLIEMPEHTIGYDGKEVWLHSKDTTAYKGKPKFYYNLMFYFYAMPFILADDGINYSEAESLVFEGETYPGIKISYNAGIGESPEDEYILYYDAKTHKMVWLGYTVTFFSKEKGKEFHFIKYSNWQNVDGLLLPEILTWYAYENNQPTEKKKDVKFIDVKVSKEKPNQIIFEMPEGAEVVK